MFYEWHKDAANRILFVMIDSNGDEVTGLGTGFTLELSKNGAAFAGSAGTKAEVGNGWYSYVCTVGESDTLGIVALRATGAGAVQQNMVATVTQIPAAVWSETARTLTQTAAQMVAVVAGSAITIHRGDSLSFTLTGLGSLVGYVSLDFSVKKNESDDDSDAIIRIRLNASGSNDGLLAINGATPRSAANGSITIDDAGAGDITVALSAVETIKLVPRSKLHYDVQLIKASSVTTLTYEECAIVADVTRVVQ